MNLSWEKIVLIALFAVQGFATIARIGKTNKPTTPPVAAILTLIQVGLIALVVFA